MIVLSYEIAGGCRINCQTTEIKCSMLLCFHFQPGITDSIPSRKKSASLQQHRHTWTVHLNRRMKRCASEVAWFYVLEKNVCVMHSFVTLKTDRKEFGPKRVNENSSIIVRCGNCMHNTMEVTIKQQQSTNTHRAGKSQQQRVNLQALKWREAWGIPRWKNTLINKLVIDKPSSKLPRVITPNSIFQMERISLTTMSGIFRIKLSLQTRKSLLSFTALYFV